MKGDTDYYARLRSVMVDQQIVSRGIKDTRVLAAMRKVPRHLFVPPELVNEAYNDSPLPIGLKQTISQPYIVALMSELLELKGTERVLEIGTGSGYQAAILSHLAKEVFTIELLDSLAKTAAERLIALHCANVHVKFGDGYEGWTQAAPFDAIIVTAAAPFVPDSLKAQLADGGRLVIPLEEPGGGQVLSRLVKQGKEIVRTDIEPVRFVPMRGKIESE